MANEQNLIPFNKRTESEQREYAKKGGKKSGETRRKRKAMKEQMDLLLILPFKQSEQLEFIKSLGIDTEEIDNQMALMVALYGKALKGDIQAIQEIRKIMQDEQSQGTENQNRINIINDLPNKDDREGK